MMGGNAFKNKLEVSRVNQEDFYDVTNSLLKKFAYGDFKVVPSYRSKPDHGDIDIVYNNQEASNEIIHYLKNYLDVPSDWIIRNSNVTSFIYKYVTKSSKVLFIQVDLIYHPSEIFDCALDYYSFNDMGNLVGRIAHKMGLKYGHDGLKYVHNDGDNRVFEINLSKNVYIIHEFLGFDPSYTKKIFQEHPETLQDIFEYVASSKYFDPDIYLLHNRNHISRVRDRKRKTYMEFLKWCESLPEGREYIKFSGDKVSHQEAAIKRFGAWEKYLENVEAHEKSKRYKTKFNGEMLMEITGYKGKELGEIMQKVKKVLGTVDLDYLSSDTVRSMVKDICIELKVYD